MARYICNRCGYESFSKRNAERHINKTIQCKTNEETELKLIIIDDILYCDKCNKKYKTFDSLKRHQKSSCKIINTTNNVQINNNYITISLTPYNDPNMKGMQPYLEAALRKTFLSIPNLIENVHFNNEYPENQNICITNKRTNDAKVFDGKKWKTVNKELLLNEIVDTYERELTNYAEENGKTRFIKDYESAKRRGGVNAEKDLKEEVHNVIYDNSIKVNTRIKEVKKLQSETESFDQED